MTVDELNSYVYCVIKWKIQQERVLEKYVF